MFATQVFLQQNTWSVHSHNDVRHFLAVALHVQRYSFQISPLVVQTREPIALLFISTSHETMKQASDHLIECQRVLTGKRCVHVQLSIFVALTLLYCLLNTALGTASTRRERTSVLKFASSTFDHKDTTIHDLEVEAGVVEVLLAHLRRTVEDNGSAAVKETERMCKLLVLVFRCSDEVVAQSFCKIGALLVTSVLKLVAKHRESGAESKYAERLLRRVSSVEISLQSVKSNQEILAVLLEKIGSTHDGKLSMVNHSLSLLAGLAAHSDSKAIVMKFPGLFEAVVDVAYSNSVVEIKYQSARVLSKLAWHVKNRASMGQKQKCIDALVAMSEATHQNLQFEALTALQLLSIVSDNKAKFIASTKGKLVPTLVHIASKDDNENLQLQALMTLLNLIGRDTYKSISLHPELVNNLAALSTSRKEPDAIAALAAQTIKRLATYVQVKDKCHEDLLRATVQMSHCERKIVRQWAAKSFLDQSALSSNSFYVVRDQDAMTSLASLITCSHREVKEPALEAVANLSEKRSNAKKLASSSSLITALVDSIDSETGCDDATFRRHAVRAILSLVSHRSSTRRMAKHVGLVAALSRYGVSAQDNDVELKRAALHGVIILAPFL